jgi:hypothetical protein
MAKKNDIPKIAVPKDLHKKIKILSAQSSLSIKELVFILLNHSICEFETAKEQGVEDKDIADFMDSFLEHPMTGDHINFIAQNYIESKKD